MAHPREQEVPAYVREASYTVATAVEIGALAIGVTCHEVEGEDLRLIFEIAEVTEPGVGRYATSDEADAMRVSYQESTDVVKPVLAGSLAMFGAFLAGIKAGEFAELIDNEPPIQSSVA